MCVGGGGLCLVLVWYCYLGPFKVCDYLADEERAGCFTLIVVLISFVCHCLMCFKTCLFLALPMVGF